MNTKKFIYDKLVAGIPGVPVFFQSDDENENQFPNKFPLITYYRISSNIHRANQIDELYQITPWAKTGLETEELKNSILSVLNTNDTKIIKIKLSVGSDMLDPSTKLHGIPITFGFSIRGV